MAEQILEPKPLQGRELNGEAGDGDEADPVDETAKKKKKKKKKNKTASVGEAAFRTHTLTGLRSS